MARLWSQHVSPILHPTAPVAVEPDALHAIIPLSGACGRWAVAGPGVGCMETPPRGKPLADLHERTLEPETPKLVGVSHPMARTFHKATRFARLILLTKAHLSYRLNTVMEHPATAWRRHRRCPV